jgi:hypothetical protein
MVDGRFPEEIAREEELRRKLIEEAKQADLQLDFERKRTEQAELKQRLLQEHGAALEGVVSAHLSSITDLYQTPEIQKVAIDLLAEDLVSKKAFDPALHADLMRDAEKVIGPAMDAVELQSKQEAEEQARKAEELKQQEADKQAREQKSSLRP